MNRFRRFSRISAARLLRSKIRRARCSALITCMLLGAAIIPALQQLPLRGCSRDTGLRGVHYIPPDSNAEPAAPPVCQAEPPAPELRFSLPVYHMDWDIPIPDPVDDSELAATDEIPFIHEDFPEWQETPPQRKVKASSPRPAAAAPEKKSSIAAAVPLRIPHPAYPARMRQRRMEGDVGICIHIDAAGLPTAVDILTEVHPDFAEHTRRWILRHWRFRAAQKGTVAIASTMRTTIRYRLEE